jgi:hypothetical protein
LADANSPLGCCAIDLEGHPARSEIAEHLLESIQIVAAKMICCPRVSDQIVATSLPLHERPDFARFILSLRARRPDAVALAKAKGLEAITSALARDPDECEAVKGSALPPTLKGNAVEGECLIALPLSPTMLFFICNREHQKEVLLSMRPTSLVKEVNRWSVLSAADRVYGTGKHHLPLVEKFLRSDNGPPR